MTIRADLAAKIVDPTAYADGSIYSVYKWLRQNDPMGRVEADGYDPFRIVTRHADIMQIGRQNELFHNGQRPVLVSRSRLELQGQAGAPQVQTLISMDPPEHAAYRALTASWFQPSNLNRLESRMRELARAAVDRMAASGGRCDFVTEIALHYPLLIIMEILGLPSADEPLMLKLTQEIFGASDPELNPETGGGGAAAEKHRALALATVQTMLRYFLEVSENRRKGPTEDLASVIANARLEDQPLSLMATMGYYVIIATAGHDTTSSSTAGGMWALAENPGEFAKLRADPSLIPTMVEEAIRWTSPVKHFMRTATCDCEVGGGRIAKGEWLMLCYASGNRDEAVFEDGDSFRVDRKGARGIAFGYGAHMCLGQWLARMEMRILFEELLPRLQSVELDGPPAMSEALFVNGPKRLPLRYTMA